MQRTMNSGSARAVADLEERTILASVELAASPERVFRALSSPEITNWWVRSGVFDTRTWTGDVRPGGAWRASGVARGKDYELEGEFLEVGPSRRLVHTWKAVDPPGATTTVTYLLEQIDAGTRVTLRHSGFDSPAVCTNTAIGWETSFERLAEILAERD
jgi:uncharacterized protein YndB with AHSA1/START domain